MNINILEGSAGIIEVLLSIYENKEFSDINDKVLATANLAYKNVANHKDFVNSISGFGCGNDGVIAALARLLAITDNKEIEGTLRELLNVERNISPMKKIYSSSGWHKGYPGILLSRLILKKSNYKDSLIDIEIREALEQTIKNGFGNSPYYYNGDIGNLEILEYAAEVLNDTSLKNRCTNTFNTLVEKVIESAIKDEVNFQNKSISFMTGLAGQGYSLIKKCGGDLVPQILWLQ
jgi:lantibiotic modifying enzyme